MGKCIKSELIFGNALISNNKQYLTTKEIFNYWNFVDKLLPSNYYTISDTTIEDFCENYSFLVEKIGDNIIVKNFELLNRYFRIGLPVEITEVFNEASTIFRNCDIENTQSQKELKLTTYNKCV